MDVMGYIFMAGTVIVLITAGWVRYQDRQEQQDQQDQIDRQQK